MSDLTAEQLTILRKLGAHPALKDSVVAHDLIASMVDEIDRSRAAVAADRERVRQVVRVAVDEHFGELADPEDVDTGLAIATRAADQLAAADGCAHVAMLLLDGLTGHRSATVFEAARHAESLIATIPGRAIELEPTRKGESIHADQPSWAAVKLSAAELRGLQLMRRHLDDDGHDWSRSPTAASDVQAAREFLDRTCGDGR